MKNLNTLFARFAREDNGAAMIEYSILIGLIAATLVTAVGVVSGWVSGRWTNLCTALGKVC